VTYTDNAIAHVMDVGANYWSLWNWHHESADNVLRYYRQYPAQIDLIARRVGYRVRPSFIWHYEAGPQNGLVVGLANDGIAGVPGVLRLSVSGGGGNVLATGCLDAGFPLPGKIRQAQLSLPAGTDWRGSTSGPSWRSKGCSTPSRGPALRSETTMAP